MTSPKAWSIVFEALKIPMQTSQNIDKTLALLFSDGIRVSNLLQFRAPSSQVIAMMSPVARQLNRKTIHDIDGDKKTILMFGDALLSPVDVSNYDHPT